MAFVWQNIKYGWTALASLGVLTGATIYVASNVWHTVTPVDIIEPVIGTWERGEATRTDTNSWKVVPLTNVRTYKGEGFTEVKTNAFGWQLDRQLMVDMDASLFSLIPCYADFDNIYEGSTNLDDRGTFSVTGLFDKLNIGDGTNQFTRTPARDGNPATYGAWPWQIHEENLVERYKVIYELKSTDLDFYATNGSYRFFGSWFHDSDRSRRLLSNDVTHATTWNYYPAGGYYNYDTNGTWTNYVFTNVYYYHYTNTTYSRTNYPGWHLVPYNVWVGPTGVFQYLPWSWDELKEWVETMWSYSTNSGEKYHDSSYNHDWPYIVWPTNVDDLADGHYTHSDGYIYNTNLLYETPEGFLTPKTYWVQALNQHTDYVWPTNLTTNIVGVIDGLFFRAWIPSIIAGNYCYTKEKALGVLYPPSETDASTNTWHDLLPFTSPCSNGLTITFDDGNPLAAPAAFPAWCDEPVLAICIARGLSDPSPYTNLPDVTVRQYTTYPYYYTRYNIYTGGVSKTKGMVLNKAGLSYYVGKVDWEFEYCKNKFW